MLAASSWFSGFSAVSSLALSIVSVVVASLAAVAAYRAFHVQHWDSVTDRLYNSLGDLLVALIRIESAAQKLYRSSGDDVRAVGEVVRPDFAKFEEAVVRVSLALAERSSDPVGFWVMDTANNLAVSLLQADEFGVDWQNKRGWPYNSSVERPAYVRDDHQWELLTKSASFWTAYGVTDALGPPPANDLDFLPVDEWWSRENPWLALDVGWIAQHSRLLSDFGRAYISPWAENLVTSQRPRRFRRTATRTFRKRNQTAKASPAEVAEAGPPTRSP